MVPTEINKQNSSETNERNVLVARRSVANLSRSVSVLQVEKIKPIQNIEERKTKWKRHAGEDVQFTPAVNSVARGVLANRALVVAVAGQAEPEPVDVQLHASEPRLSLLGHVLLVGVHETRVDDRRARSRSSLRSRMMVGE